MEQVESYLRENIFGMFTEICRHVSVFIKLDKLFRQCARRLPTALVSKYTTIKIVAKVIIVPMLPLVTQACLFCEYFLSCLIKL
jgi:hypothetical protein